MSRFIIISGLVLLLFSCDTAGNPPAENNSEDDNNPVTFNLAGTVTYVKDTGNIFNGEITVGQTITGQYTFYVNAVDTHTADTIGDYRFTQPECGIIVNIGDRKFQTDSSNVNLLIEIVNNHGAAPSDNYVVRSYNNLKLDETNTVDHISWQLDDSTANAIDNTALTSNPPDLSKWTAVVGLTVTGNDDAYFIRMNVTSVVKQ